MKPFLFVLSLACILPSIGCVHTARSRSSGTSTEVGEPGQKHQVTLIIDGKVVGQWTTTGKIEINGATFKSDDRYLAPSLTESPQ